MGEQMKCTSGWNNNGNGSNSIGFTGLPGGCSYSGGFNGNGYNGYWWSASESGSYSWACVLLNNLGVVLRGNNDRGNGFSTRCVRDKNFKL